MRKSDQEGEMLKRVKAQNVVQNLDWHVWVDLTLGCHDPLLLRGCSPVFATGNSQICVASTTAGAAAMLAG